MTNGTTIFKTILLLLFAAFLFSGCGSSSNDNNNNNNNNENNNNQENGVQKDAVDTSDPAYKAFLREKNDKLKKDLVKGERIINNINISPEPVYTNSEITIQVDTNTPLTDSHKLRFRLQKNNKPMPETTLTSTTIPAFTFKKNDFITIEAQIYDMQDKLIDAVVSPIILVQNAAPVIDEVVFPQIQGPGNYEFKVKATDMDGDTLTYTLAPGNLPSGSAISADGVVSVTLGVEVPDAFEFTVTVDDGCGGNAQKIITMKMFKKPVKK